MVLTGAQIIIECLKEQGVDTVFGYPGGTILNVYDALYQHRDEIFHVLTSHEQGAAHAADGYARATGKVGVCMATSGPGATNLVTGIATAYMDSVPIVAITANVNLPLLGKDTFQEVDIAGVTMPITKHGFIVKDVNILASTIRKAFRIAKSGRPGPVLVDVTKDVTANTCEFSPALPMPAKRRSRYTQADIDSALDLIEHAKRPFLYVGGGAILSEASEEVRAFAKRVDAPVCDTLMGKGAFDGYDPLYTGMIGMHGTKASNLGVSRCDLLIALGARFSDRVVGNAAKFAAGAKVLHIDIDAAEINKNVVVDACVIGDLKEALKRLDAAVAENRSRSYFDLEEFSEKGESFIDIKPYVSEVGVSEYTRIVVEVIDVYDPTNYFKVQFTAGPGMEDAPAEQGGNIAYFLACASNGQKLTGYEASSGKLHVNNEYGEYSYFSFSDFSSHSIAGILFNSS